MNRKFTKVNTIKYIIIIVTVGLLSIVPYTIYKNNYKDKKAELTKDTEYKLKDLDYSIPKGFTYRYYNNDLDNRYYSLYAEHDSCSIVISRYKNYPEYKNGESYLKDNASFTLNDEVSEITEVDSNQKNWYTITKKTNNTHPKTETSFVYVKKDDIYVVEYSYRDYDRGDYEEDNKSSACKAAKDYVLSHLKVN